MNEMRQILTTNRPFSGIEIGCFKLRKGFTEAELIEIAKQVERKFLCFEEGFIAHHLLKGLDKNYADLVIASTQEKAERICAKWLYNEYTRKYLEYIDPESVDISFWTVIENSDHTRT